MQGDVFLLGMLLALAYWAQTLEHKSWKIWLQILVVLSFLLVFSDIITIIVYQQRFSFSLVSGMIANADAVIWQYLLYAVIWIGIFIGILFLIGRFVKFSLTKHAILLLIGMSIIVKLLPMPILQVSWGDLPTETVFAQWIKDYYELNLDEQKNKGEKSDFSLLSLDQKAGLEAQKLSWLRFAKLNAENLFAEFPQKALVDARDQEGNDYVKEVLQTALIEQPELAFRYLDNYKDRKDQSGKGIVKDLLEFAISQKPQLAYSYLEVYEELVESNEKIAKSLLEKATDLYENKLNFQDLFTLQEGRNNKKNLILVFFESASAVDSKKTGGFYDKFPQTDKISQEGTLFTNMMANGVTSEMGHIATLMGVEPQFLGTSTKTGYERFSGAVAGLWTFFKNLGYKTHFVSTASLDFLNQRFFLKKVWFDTLWEDNFGDWKKYTFNAFPDEALYQKTLDVVKSQTSPYFLTLQTISSHTPYSTPYGNSADEAFRYMDESFAKFYIQLKASGFFENGILLVVWDHRKMTPMEAQEHTKRWANADTRVMSFLVWDGIETGKIDDNLYQQTDIFYSLMREFGSWDVEVLSLYNDLFSKNIVRNWWIRNFYTQTKATVFNKEGQSANIEIPSKTVSNEVTSVDAKSAANYLYLGLKYQKQQNEEKLIDDSSQLTSWMVNLIAHRGEHTDTTENSMAAFYRAGKYGVKSLEFDVSVTKDGKLVVMHGPKTYATTCTQRTKDICELTYAELSKCKLTNGEDIFLLENRLPKLKPLASLLFLDLKISTNPNCSHLVPYNSYLKAKKIILDNHMQEQVVVSTDDLELTKKIWSESQIITAVDAYTQEGLDLLKQGNYLYFMTPYTNFTPAFITKLTQATNRYGQKVIPIAYTVNDLPTFRKLKKLGIRYIMTDDIPKLSEENKK